MKRVLVAGGARKTFFDLEDPSDHISKRLLRGRFYEQDLLEDATMRLRGKGVVIDVGAHIGNHTLWFARVVNRPVISLEPNPVAFRQLVQNLRVNNVRNVKAVNAAAGAKPGSATVHMDNPGNTGMAYVTYSKKGETEVVTLDSLTRDPVALIKVDVEGNELEVLKGAQRILETYHPILYIEAHDDEKRSKIESFLAKFDYEPFGQYAITPTFGYRKKRDPAILSAAIMAHPSRAEFVAELGHVGRVVWDEKNDRWDTGRRSLLAYDPAATHHVVIQDDAVVPSGLFDMLYDAIPYVDEGSPLALYIGDVTRYKRMWKPKIKSDTSWVVMPGVNWGVGLVIPTVHIPDLVAFGDKLHAIGNYDMRISRFYEKMGIGVWYPYPSLVDHRDSPSLVPGRKGGRHAAKYIGDATFNPAGGVVTANLRR